MKKLMPFMLTALFLSSLMFGQAKQTAGNNVVQEIMALENGWNDAAQKDDVSWFERNLANSYVSTDEKGKVTDKATTISNIKNKVSKIESISLEGVKVQVYGDTAVVKGVYVLKGTSKGKDVSGKYPYTDVWVKIGGHWQCVADHNSTLVSK